MNFKKLEEKWQKVWEKQGWYPAKDKDKKRKKLYVLVEFPYPSGEGLHIGHAFTMIGADIYARKKRMEGYNVLFPMGWDAFGLPAENYAIKTGIHPAVTTQKSIANFRRQMKKMAFSFDWRRELSTTDPEYYRFTQWIFIQLFKHGLAYKKKMPINWCPACRIGLANEEVVNGRCERCGAEVSRRDLNQWIIKITEYADRLLKGLEKVDFVEKVRAAQINWIGRSEGAKIKFPIFNDQFSNGEFNTSAADTSTQPAAAGGSGRNKGLYLEVFTTRPDTLWGATFMVVAPEHWLVEEILNPKSEILNNFKIPITKIQKIKAYVKQARKKSELERTELEKDKTGVFTGLYAINPVNQKKIPIWISDFVLASYGTGAIMAVPAHDERDHAFAKKYRLPIIPVIEPEEKWDFNHSAYTDVDRGWMINSGPINGLRPAEAIKETIKLLEKKGWGKKAVSYHLRDWIFSRQHYWGEPIPMIYCPVCAKKGITWWETQEGKAFLEKFQTPNPKQFENWDLKIGASSQSLAGWFPVPEEELPLELPEVKRYQPTGTGESPLAAIKDWVETKCPHCGGRARRETDTMPNWAGSNWYFIAYTFWPRQSSGKKLPDYLPLMKYWLPVDIYFGGDEHNTLHLLYSRFIYQFLWDIGAVPQEYPEPYLRRISHGLILGEDGQKMSKSRGNVVNPDEVWEKYGVDSLRAYLMFMGPYEGTMSWNSNALRGVARFLERFKKFVEKQGREKREKKKEEKEEKKRRVALNRLIKQVSRDMESFGFNTALAAQMEFLNQAEKEGWQLTREELRIIVQLLAPFAPYLTEELWQQLGGEGSVHLSSWPKPDPRFVIEDEVEIVIQVNGKLRGTVKVPAPESKRESYVVKKAKAEPPVAKHLAGKEIVKTIFVPGRLINFVVKEK